jgi:hypothetical protein
MDALELTDIQEAELHRLLRLYRRETERCKNAKAYLAGCVMAGAELETALLLMVNAYSDEAAATNKLPRRKKELKPLVEWHLSELLRVAKAANWLPSALEYGRDEWNDKIAGNRSHPPLGPQGVEGGLAGRGSEISQAAGFYGGRKIRVARGPQ